MLFSFILFTSLQTVGVPFSEKTKDGQVYLEYHEEDVQDPVMDAVLRQAYRMFTVCVLQITLNLCYGYMYTEI